MSPAPLSKKQRALAAAAAEEVRIRRARTDSSIFVDLVFGYSSASFQRAWHRALEQHRRLVLWAAIEHGKTQQITSGWSLHQLGKNPKVRGAIIGATATSAQKPFGVVKGLIEQPPPALQRIFPKLRPLRGPRAKWTDSQIRIEGTDTKEKDFSLQALGIGGDLLGARLDFAVLDDLLNLDNTYTADQRQKVTQWITAVLLGRIVEGGTVVICGNAWFPDDAMHEMERRGFVTIRDAAYEETEAGEIVADSVRWPAQWSRQRLDELRKTLGTIEAWRQLRCIPYASGQGRFDAKWFDAALERGAGLTFLDRWPVEGQPAWPAFMGVDLGVQQKEKHDKTSFWCMAVDPATGTRRPLNAFEDRLTGPQIVERLADWWDRYRAVIEVENNAAQDFIRQFAKASGVPTQPFTTGKNKADPAFGVPSLGVELEQGIWWLPNGCAASKAAMHTWRTQCLAYSPGQHVGDLLMASWFAREASRWGQPGASAMVTPERTGGPEYGRLRARYDGQRRRG
jgi:hypothetical protein